MKGLWSEHFPSAAKPPASGQLFFICPSCNAAVCRLLTSGTAENPGRQFYKCPSSDHNFFKWADQVKDDELIDVPNCGGCSAGVCRVRREKTGSNAGRILFMCRVKEGEGSCGYRVWQDELNMSVKKGLPDERVTSSQLITTNCNDIGFTNRDHIVTSLNSTMTNCDETASRNRVMVEETTQGDERVDDESPVIDTSQNCESLGVTCRKMEQPNCQEEKSDESSRRPLKRSRYGDLTAPGSLVSANSFTSCLSMNSMSIDHRWVMAAFEQKLGTQLQGWWGRLAFHPIPCLTTRASMSLTFKKHKALATIVPDVSSPVDSSFAAKEKISVNSSNSTSLNTTLCEAESFAKPPFNPADNAGPSGSKPLHFSLNLPSSSQPFHEIRTHNITSESILEAFGQAAKPLQNYLLTCLETMDIKDHEIMSQEAENIFSVLDHMLFDYQDFKKRAAEFIHCAKSLAEIEQSMPTNDCYQQLVNHCSSERTSLDKFNGLHAKSVNDVTRIKKHLKELQEEVRSTMEWIEAELSFFEVEMRTMEQQLEQMSKSKDVLEGRYLTVSRELEKFEKLYEWKEIKRSAAKAAFDKAKALLRG